MPNGDPHFDKAGLRIVPAGESKRLFARSLLQPNGMRRPDVFLPLLHCALVLLQDTPHLLGAFKAEQLPAMALMLFKLYLKASTIGSVFFGFYCLLIGYLVFRSVFLPRILSVLMMFAGVSWLTFLYPPPANSLRPYNLAPGILGEGSLTLWLLAMGVNVERWKEQAGPYGTQ